MLPDKDVILGDSQILYEYIQKKTACNFDELQDYSKLDNIHLCMALIRLMQEHKICQKSFEGGIVYTIDFDPIRSLLNDSES